MKKILCLTDFSSNSLNAVMYANEIAKKFSSTLTFMHTYKINMGPEHERFFQPSLAYYTDTESRNKLMELCMKFTKADRYSKVNYEFLVKEGKVTQHLNEIIQKNNIDLVVLSPVGEARPGDSYYGNVVAEILHKLKCPVIVVPTDYQSNRRIDNIIYAYDIQNENTLEKSAVNFARLFNANLEILSFVTEDENDEVDRIYSKYNHIKEHSGYATMNFSVKSTSDIKKAMEEIYPDRNFDLIIMENHVRNTHQQLNDPNFIKDFVFVSKVPVLVIYSEA